MIQERYVSFEIAKLLKEKGFDIHCDKGWDMSCYDVKQSRNFSINFDSKERWISAPTLYMAMEWLRTKYDLHIIAYPFKSGNDTSIKHYCCQVFKTFNLLGYEKYTNETLTSYEAAVEAAIKYSLENLI